MFTVDISVDHYGKEANVLQRQRIKSIDIYYHNVAREMPGMSISAGKAWRHCFSEEYIQSLASLTKCIKGLALDILAFSNLVEIQRLTAPYACSFLGASTFASCTLSRAPSTQDVPKYGLSGSNTLSLSAALIM